MRAVPPRPVASEGGRSYWISTLGCAKNEVDSAKLAGRLAASGYEAASSPEDADLVVVNTCAFIEPAREESVDEILELSAARRRGARLAVTGCLAERNGAELAAVIPEIDVVAGFGQDFAAALDRLPAPVGAARAPTAPVRWLGRGEVPSFDLLELPRPRVSAPWAYVKIAEGCDRRCGFCAIPSFRGRQRSRALSAILDEVDSLEVSEVVLVAQDLASYGRDRSRSRSRRSGTSEPGIAELVGEIAGRVAWVRLLYLYPSSLSDELVDAIVATGLPYFDLSLQHASRPLLRRMRRPGHRAAWMERIGRIRAAAPGAALRSSFILGYPGETEQDHDELLGFLGEAELDWAGFFTFSREEGTFADGLDESTFVPGELALERLAECAEVQEQITARRRQALGGEELHVLVEEPEGPDGDGTGRGRTYREAPEIDGVVRLSWGEASPVPAGTFVTARCSGVEGSDLLAEVTSR